MEFKGTKGVWELIDVLWINNSGISTQTVSVNNSDVAVCNSFGKNNAEALANAKLIAAAPELLEMLNDILMQREDDAFYTSISDIKALIKKATE